MFLNDIVGNLAGPEWPEVPNSAAGQHVPAASLSSGPFESTRIDDENDRNLQVLFGPLDDVCQERLAFAALENFLLDIKKDSEIDFALSDHVVAAHFAIANSVQFFLAQSLIFHIYCEDLSYLAMIPYRDLGLCQTVILVPPEIDKYVVQGMLAGWVAGQVNVFRLAADGPEGPCLLTSKPFGHFGNTVSAVWLLPIRTVQFFGNVQAHLAESIVPGTSVLAEELHKDGASQTASIDISTFPSFYLSPWSNRRIALSHHEAALWLGLQSSFATSVDFRLFSVTGMRRRAITSIYDVARTLAAGEIDKSFADWRLRGSYVQVCAPAETAIPAVELFDGCDRGHQRSSEIYRSGRLKFAELGMLTLNDVSVVGKLCQIINRENVFVIKDTEIIDASEHSFPLGNTEGEAFIGGYFHRHEGGLFSRKADIIDGIVNEEAFLVGGRHMTNHGHFMLDLFPRVWIARKLGLADRVRYVVGSDINEYQLRYLSYAGVGRERIVQTTERATHFRCLHVPAQTSTRAEKGVHPWVLDFYADLAERMRLREEYARSGDRIYVGRSGLRNDKRRMINEPALVAVLRSWGFVEVDPETVPFELVAGAIHNAKIIVGYWGSALMNLAFANESASILIIQHGRNHNLAEIFYICQRPNQRVGMFFIDSFDQTMKSGLDTHTIMDIPHFRKAFERWVAEG